MAFWLTFLVYLGTFILGELLRPKPEIEGAKPASLGDFQFPTSTEGRAVPIIWGTVRLNGPNVGWYGDLKTVEITEEIQTGLFSSDNVTVGFEYYIGIDLMLCRGDLETISPANAGIRRIWIDDDELRPASAGWVDNGSFTINQPNFFGEDSGGIVGTFTLFPGSINQIKSTYLEGVVDDSTLLPAYRGTAHLVMEQIYVGNAPSLRPISIEMRRVPNGLNLTAAQSLIGGQEANPANVVYEIMTNTEWGLGITNINEAQLAATGVTLASEGNGYSRILDNPRQAASVLQEIEQQCDGFLVQNPTTNEWEFRLIRETDYPSPVTAVPLFDESNMLSMDFSRGAWSDTANQVKVQFTDRDKNYQPSFAVAQDMANKIIQNNDDVISTENYPAVQDRSLANNLAWRDLRTLSYPLGKGTLRSDRSNYTLVPGDLVRITWPPYGLENFFARINRVSLGTEQANEILYDFTEDIFRTEVPSFGDPTDTLWNPPDQNPVDVAAARIISLPIGYQDVNTKQQFGLLAVRGNTLQTEYRVYRFFDPTLPITTQRSAHDLDSVISPFTPSGLLLNPVSISPGSPESYIDDSIIIDSTTDIQAVNQTAVLADLDNPIPPNLALINDEWIFFESITDLGAGQYRLNNVHRGMLDSAPGNHAANDRVWFVSYGVGVLQGEPISTDDGISIWFMSTSGGGTQGAPDGSPEQGVQAVIDITDTSNSLRYIGPSAPIDVRADGVALGVAETLPDSFRLTWDNRLNSFTDRSKAQNHGNESVSYTYNVRVYHTGVSPEVETYNVTGISSTGAASPVNAEHDVSGYAVDPSPITSPFPSPEPFAQTYRVEIEAVFGSPEVVSPKWSHNFVRQ